jgi:hypothetical protein
MNDRIYTMTVITIFTDGTKNTKDVTYGCGRNAWTNAMKNHGNFLQRARVQREDIAKVVVINGTDVFTYEGGEPAEILGL